MTFQIFFAIPLPALMQRHLNHFRQMKRLPRGRLRDLFAATETVSDDQCVFALRPHSRQKHTFTTFHRDVVMFILKTKSACHATTTRLGHLVVDLHLFQDRFFSFHLHDVLVMAMTMHESFLCECW